MKTTIIFLLGILFFNTFASAESLDEKRCQARLVGHLQTIESSEEVLSKLAIKSKTINGYEISEMQKNITKRYNSLKSFMNFYEDDSSNCESVLLSKVVAIYDFTLFGNTVLVNKDLRRILINFTKYAKFELNDFIEAYKKYTSNKYITLIQTAIEVEDTKMPNGIELKTSVKKKFSTLNDKAVKGAGGLVGGVARLLGFVSDKLIFRNGHLQDNTKALNLLSSKLKPLDLIFEKRTYVLSNYTIPGHWGHVSIWLGTKEELEELGVWDQDYFAPFKAQVLAGKNILEIRKQGVNYQSLEEYINLDEIAVTRVKNILSNADQVFYELSQQIEKKYDYEFDSHSLNKITCSELIAFSYGNISWTEKKTLFQTSLSPDGIAVATTYNNAPEEFVLYLKSKKDRSFESLDFNAWRDLFKAPKSIIVKENQEDIKEQKKVKVKHYKR